MHKVVFLRESGRIPTNYKYELTYKNLVGFNLIINSVDV